MLFDYSEYLKELSCFLRLPQTDIKINSFIYVYICIYIYIFIYLYQTEECEKNK